MHRSDPSGYGGVEDDMEPVTHLLTGACLSRAGFNRKTAYATAALVLAAEAPDIDMLWEVRGPVATLQHHRGITHTLVAAPFMALLVVAVFWLWHQWRGKPGKAGLAPRWGWLWLGAFVADLSHLLLDFTNNYGLRPFFPFDKHWYAWGIVSIFDPYIFAALLLALLIPALLKLTDQEIGDRRKRFRGRGWAWTALIFMLLYWAVRNGEHEHALALLRNNNDLPVPVSRVAAEPRMFDPFAWKGLLETSAAYRTAQVKTLDDQITIGDAPVYKPAETPVLEAAKQSYLGRVYLDWANWPLVEDMGEVAIPGEPAPPKGQAWHAVEFRDLRYTSTAAALGLNEGAGAGRQAPLSGWVYVNVTHGMQPEVEAMYMDGREQK